ncbi:MAG TPA: hypothetical protein VIY66_06090 [Candidatus Acidoferrales bacterium]
MRALATCAVVLGLMVSPTLARAGGPGDKDSANKASAANGKSAANAAPAAAADAAGKAEPSSIEIESELRQMRDLLEAQAKQLQEQQQKMNLLEEQLKASQPGLTAESPASAPVATAAPESAAPNSVGPVGPVTGAVAAAQPPQEKNPEEPTSIHYKGITLTPGGFMAAETVWRQKALAADVNTPLNGIPFDGSSNAHLSEFQASGRQSRISMLIQGQLSDVKIGGYYEADFLSAGTTSNPNESNSYTLRQRQFWGQAAFNNGVTFTGGQQWSLITETTHGMDNRTENLPMTIDAQYHVGFSWARQYGARITKSFNNKVWLGFALEESQPTLTVHGNPTAQAASTTLTCTTPGTNGCSAAGTYTINLNPTFNNFLLGAFGTGGGLDNPLANYGYNDAPDFVVKAVFEPGFGHYEIFGVGGAVHDRIFPCVANSAILPGCTGTTPALSGFGARNNSAMAGGVGANARWNLFAKKVDLGVHFLGGTGIGRYGSGGLPDLTVRPDGTLVPVHNFQALGTFQLHPTPKLDIYMNVGGEFEERTFYTTSTGKPEGYGALGFSNAGCWTETLPITGPATNTNLGVPTGVGGGTGFIPGALGSCTGDTRNLLEGTLGFWYRFYKGSKGTVQYGMQYSNVDRNTWRGVAGSGPAASGQPHADENMVFTSFRYYLP